MDQVTFKVLEDEECSIAGDPAGTLDYFSVHVRIGKQRWRVANNLTITIHPSPVQLHVRLQPSVANRGSDVKVRRAINLGLNRLRRWPTGFLSRANTSHLDPVPPSLGGNGTIPQDQL